METIQGSKTTRRGGTETWDKGAMWEVQAMVAEDWMELIFGTDRTARDQRQGLGVNHHGRRRVQGALYFRVTRTASMTPLQDLGPH